MAEITRRGRGAKGQEEKCGWFFNVVIWIWNFNRSAMVVNDLFWM